MQSIEEFIGTRGIEEIILFGDGKEYDTALIGVTYDDRAIYDYDLMVEWLMKHDKRISYQDAMEWIDYNVLNAYIDPKQPIIMFRRDGVFNEQG